MKKAGKFLAAVLILVIAGSCCMPGFAEETEKEATIDEIISGMTIREKVGQMVMADFRTWNEHPEDENAEVVPVTELRPEIEEAISKNRFGGIILFAENCEENEQTLRLVSRMQEANMDTDSGIRIPLLIAADQEGGSVARLGQGTRWIGNMAITATADPQNAKAVAARIGEELSLLSINTDFAPVLDVNNNPGNPVIGCRSFSDDPEIVAEYGACFLEGLSESNTISAVKHFPGHGDVNTDSHTGFPILEKTYEELKECELIPFRAAIDAGADMVMTAHIQYPKIEDQTYVSVSTGEEVYFPATLSRKILTEILRKDLGFEGVIVSDALNMAAIADNFEPQDVWQLAIEAGIDMFLMPVPVTDADSLQKLEDMITYISGMAENGEIPEETINDSVRRILALKEKYHLLTEADTEVTKEKLEEAAAKVGSQENHDFEWELMQKAVTLLKNDDFLPIKAEPGEKVLLIYSAGSRLASGEFARLRLVGEGLLPEDVVFEAITTNADEPDAYYDEALENADYVIAVSTMFGEGELDPASEEGADGKVFDYVLQAAHDAGKKFLLISAYLPYDASRYPDADAILVTYGSAPMRELPKEKESYSVNIPAAICGAFGEYEFSGSLAADLPAIDEDYRFADQICYFKNK